MLVILYSPNCLPNFQAWYLDQNLQGMLFKEYVGTGAQQRVLVWDDAGNIQALVVPTNWPMQNLFKSSSIIDKLIRKEYDYLSIRKLLLLTAQVEKKN